MIREILMKANPNFSEIAGLGSVSVERVDQDARDTVPVHRNTNRPRLTANGTVLDVLLDFTTRLIYGNFDTLAAVRTIHDGRRREVCAVLVLVEVVVV